MPQPNPTPQNPPPQRTILVLAASPTDMPGLRLDKEIREIDEGLRLAKQRDSFKLEQRLAVRTEDLRRALLQYEPQIVHFCGHGETDGIFLENDAGTKQLVPKEALTNLFKLFGKKGVQCVVLNACYSDEQAEEISQHINFVVGMSRAVGDKAAIQFAVGFYDALGADWSYEEAYELGCNAIALERIPEELTPVLKRMLDIPREPQESRCYQTILQPGSLLRIKAPQYMGKTRMLNRVLGRFTNNDYQIVVLNFQNRLDSKAYNSLEQLLQAFCVCVSHRLKLPDNLLDEYWHNRNDNDIIDRTTVYFQDHILERINSPLILVLEDIDRVFERPLATDFCNLLRGWHGEAQREELWQKLRLVIVHSTDVYASVDINSSPLANAGETVTLDEFTLEQVKDLVRQHELDWNRDMIEQLMALVGGHPYLINHALKTIVNQSIRLEEVLAKAPTEEGIYRNHLRSLWETIKQQPALKEALKKVVTASHPVRVDPFQLYSLGLVKIEGNNAIPRCNLYRQYFSALFTEEKTNESSWLRLLSSWWRSKISTS